MPISSADHALNATRYTNGLPVQGLVTIALGLDAVGPIWPAHVPNVRTAQVTNESSNSPKAYSNELAKN